MKYFFIVQGSLARELAYGVINRKKIEEAQQAYLHKFQKAELKAEFEVLISLQTELFYLMLDFDFQPIICYYERILDMKDFAISLLVVELNEAEIQNQVNLKAYWSNMDKLFGKYIPTLSLSKIRDNYIYLKQKSSNLKYKNRIQ